MHFAHLVDIYLKYFADSTARLDNFSHLLGQYQGAPVLDCAVGTGSITLDMISQGFEIQCSDASEDMLARFVGNAQARGLAVEPRKLFWHELGVLDPEQYGLIICKGNSFAYLNAWEQDNCLSGRTEMLLNLRSMHAALLPGGALYIDFPKASNARWFRQSHPAKRVCDTQVHIREQIETDFCGKRRRWLVDMCIGGTEHRFARYSHLIHKDELRAYLFEAGFAAVECTYNLDDRDHYEALLAFK